MSSGLNECPHCGTNLIGKPIPEDQRHLFGNHEYFKREIGLVYNDRVVRWKCPDCGETWERK